MIHLRSESLETVLSIDEHRNARTSPGHKLSAATAFFVPSDTKCTKHIVHVSKMIFQHILADVHTLLATFMAFQFNEIRWWWTGIYAPTCILWLFTTSRDHISRSPNTIPTALNQANAAPYVHNNRSQPSIESSWSDPHLCSALP